MSNKAEPRFDEITDDNKQEFKDKFCLSVGHTNSCIEETVEAMSKAIHEDCISSNANIADVLNSITVESFDRKIRHLLSNKTCNCCRPDNLN